MASVPLITHGSIMFQIIEGDSPMKARMPMTASVVELEFDFLEA